MARLETMPNTTEYRVPAYELESIIEDYREIRKNLIKLRAQNLEKNAYEAASRDIAQIDGILIGLDIARNLFA